MGKSLVSCFFDSQCRRLCGELFKMTHNIYVPDVSLKLEYNSGCSTRGNKSKLLSAHFTMICENIIFLHVSLIFGKSLPNYVVVDVVTMN